MRSANLCGVALGVVFVGLVAGCSEQKPPEKSEVQEALPPLEVEPNEPENAPPLLGTGGSVMLTEPGPEEVAEQAVCGDGKLSPGETCDDANTEDADGCSAACAVEPGYICLEPGTQCIQEVCGDGSRTVSETCDDGNTVPTDGCDSTCQVESGWVCPTQGAACLPRCGDGLLVGAERCDDGNTTTGDGCGGGCLIEPGWFDCPPTGATCQQAVCGNGVTEANEGCDDANDINGDGCNASCLREPVFEATGEATAVCGDGARTLGEECDDGNVLEGDGCSASCTSETGFKCEDIHEEPDVVRLPVVFRDFTDDHPDMQNRAGPVDLGIPGPVCTLENTANCGTLDAEGKPVLDETTTHRSITGTAADFAQWYRDVPEINMAFPSSIELTKMTENGQTIYRFESEDFFPLDDQGFGNYGNFDHNYHFTTELEYFIQYEGGEYLDFSGDDDVWIFVNHRLAVDIGGIHDVESAFVLLGDENGDGEISEAEATDPTDDRFGLEKGRLYSIKLFHAERRTTESNFKLTLSNFILSHSVCAPICGSGTLEPGEYCDDGVEANTGAYGACAPDCSGRQFCGDGIVQAEGGEQCDDGVNLAPYNGPEGTCAPGCTTPARCGDSVVDHGYGETCDLGDRNGVENSGCDELCRLKEILQ